MHDIVRGKNAFGYRNPRVWIYGLCEPDTGEIRYVGQTHYLKKRYHEHVFVKTWRPRRRLYFWVASLRSKNLWPRLLVLEIVAAEDRCVAERWWISFLRREGHRLTNATDGGEGTSGLKIPMSDETKAKLSAAHMGKKMSAECCLKMSKAKKGGHGPRWTEAQRRNWRAVRLGHEVTTEMKLKSGNAQSTPITVELIREMRRRFDGGESCRHISRSLDLTYSRVWNIVTRQTYKGVE